MTKSSLVYFEDMVQFAGEAIEYLGHRDAAEFALDRRTFRAIERSLEILGEAAKRVPMSDRERFAGLPWRRMTGLRDVIAHEYDDIDHHILVRLIREELPPLIDGLREIVTLLRREAGEIS